MTLSDAIFSVHGCFVTIDDFRADVSSKRGLLSLGLCNVRAVDPRHQHKAEDLQHSPVEGAGIMACNDPRLIELAARYWDWSNSDAADFPDTPTDVFADPVQAASAFAAWLNSNP